MSVKILQPLEDLFGPLLECLNGDMAVLPAVIPEVPGSANLSDEIDVVAFLILPNTVTDDDVLVAEGSEQLNLRMKTVDENRIFAEIPEPNLIPRHLNSFLLIKSSVNLLHSSTAEKIVVTPKPSRRINLHERFHFGVATVGLLRRHFQSLSYTKLNKLKNNHETALLLHHWFNNFEQPYFFGLCLLITSFFSCIVTISATAVHEI